MPWIKCLGGGGGKARRGKPLSVSQPIHLLVKVRFSFEKFSAATFRGESRVSNRAKTRSTRVAPFSKDFPVHNSPSPASFLRGEKNAKFL